MERKERREKGEREGERRLAYAELLELEEVVLSFLLLCHLVPLQKGALLLIDHLRRFCSKRERHES